MIRDSASNITPSQPLLCCCTDLLYVAETPLILSPNPSNSYSTFSFPKYARSAHPLTNMKTSALLLVVALRAVVASELTDVLSQFPDCSLECIAAGAESFDCDLTDLDCQCGQMEGITAEVSPCMVEAGCEFEDITSMFFSLSEVLNGD